MHLRPEAGNLWGLFDARNRRRRDAGRGGLQARGLSVCENACAKPCEPRMGLHTQAFEIKEKSDGMVGEAGLEPAKA